MTILTAYSKTTFQRRMHVISKRFLFTFQFIFAISIPSLVSAQDEPYYDEISVSINVQGVGGGEISSVISEEELFLPVTDLFDFLKIKNTTSSGLDSISGFFIDQKSTYLIDRINNRIIYQDKEYALSPGDLVRTETNLYLKAIYLGKIFGLECKFDFRSLSVAVQSKLELPVIREMKQEEMRNNINRLKGEFKADTTIGRSYPLFHFGMADWSAIATEEVNGKSDARLNLNLGSIIAGGEMTTSLYYNSAEKFSEKQQQYRWRYVNNDRTALRQVVAGKIATQATSSIYNPVVGVQVTNTPTTFRRSFGTYTLSDKTEPGWIVELYVNNVLVDYVKADASGFFTFEVPLVYGNSIVQLKFYGPWGEERTREQNINIPYNFLPEKTFEYTAGAGVVEDTVGSIFARASMGYGVTKSMTAGGGMEYLSSVSSGPSMPYLNMSLKLTNNIIFSGEYTYGVRSKADLSYRLPSNIQFDLNYTRYDKNQKAINYNYIEERKLLISLPIKSGKFTAYNRFSIDQMVLRTTKYTTGEWMVSTPVFGVSTNLTTYALFVGKNNPNIYSNLSLSLKLPADITLYPQTQYSYTDKNFMSAKLKLERHLFDNGFLDLSYEQNFKSDLKSGEIGFRYDFSFAQMGSSFRRSNKLTTLVQHARGSIINDRQTKYLKAEKNTNVGKGGISIVPYLDLNANGVRDKGEPKVSGLNIHAGSGQIQRSDRDSTIRILGLEPYTTCYLELDPYSFDNISWKLKNQTLAVAIDPNKLKLIEVPVTVAGEATGMVSLDEKEGPRGLSRIIVNFYTQEMKLAGRTLTESDGYFSYLGFAPGSYIASIDTSQLRKLNLQSAPESRSFIIKQDFNGDIVDGLDFTVGKDVTVTPKVPIVMRDTSIMIIHEVTQELVTITEDTYAIQLGAYKEISNAEVSRKKLENLVGRDVEIVNEEGFYKVRISDLKDRKQVDDIISILRQNGVTEVWVISLKAKKQKWIIKEKSDTMVVISDTIPMTEDEIAMRLSAFRMGSNAITMKDMLSQKLDQKVEVLPKNGLLEVRKSKESSSERRNGKKKLEYAPLLYPRINEVLVSPVKTLSVKEPAVPFRVNIAAPEKISCKFSVPLVVKHDSISRINENKIVVPAIHAETTYSLHVAVFLKRSQALRAQRRITTRLDVPVEIVKQLDSYHVLITGFASREETFKYYPELAGMGYPGVSLIQDFKRRSP